MDTSHRTRLRSQHLGAFVDKRILKKICKAMWYFEDIFGIEINDDCERKLKMMIELYFHELRDELDELRKINLKIHDIELMSYGVAEIDNKDEKLEELDKLFESSNRKAFAIKGKIIRLAEKFKDIG
ncbi:hypothetical protein [Kangiella koreensis]|uniref:Uncharacterized protein n=1 Tax=Kangiella koreensis (strain DSM 16069 / JCM 12317 / KCTC 12182 / SW-125) TaxID=523791 RepID=C7RBV1_KANKD|nr:hypothetical protein [Kangiella koreensis]ACV26743.1 hypothetical protein Kkor_1330 [Kangiella koreensis DSM 16069]